MNSCRINTYSILSNSPTDKLIIFHYTQVNTNGMHKIRQLC